MTKSISEQLDVIAGKINAGWVESSKFWGGASVAITNVAPDLSGPGFYPDHSVVVTPRAGELSWLFVLLRDVAVNLDDFALWKAEFFGRLAVAAQSVPDDVEVKILLLQVIRQAYEMLGMIEIGMEPAEFSIAVEHPRALGRGVDPFDRDELAAFYATRGIAIS